MKQTPSSESTSLQELTIDQVLSAPEAADAFKKLVQDGMKRDELIDQLCVISILPRKKAPLIPEMRDPGGRKFPDRVERIADAIEHVNRRGALLCYPALQAEGESRSSSLRWGPARLRLDLFEALPKVLRAYAEYLRATILDSGKDRLSFQKWATLRLLVMVRAATGRAHLREVVLLLDAAFDAVGDPKVSDEDALRHFYKSHRPLVLAIRHTLAGTRLSY